MGRGGTQQRHRLVSIASPPDVIVGARSRAPDWMIMPLWDALYEQTLAFQREARQLDPRVEKWISDFGPRRVRETLPQLCARILYNELARELHGADIEGSEEARKARAAPEACVRRMALAVHGRTVVIWRERAQRLRARQDLSARLPKGSHEARIELYHLGADTVEQLIESFAPGSKTASP